MLIGNKIFRPSESCLLRGDSCTAELLAIIHEIQTNFDSNPPVDVRGLFLDIFKIFDKTWHKSLLSKLKSYGVEGKLLSVLKCYVINREQRVVLNCQTSDWRKKSWCVTRVSIRSNFILDI